MRVRYPTYEPAPFVRGIERQRYEWLPEDDPDIERLHAAMQEGGPGMYLVYDPARGQRVLIEAYEPWELPVQYREPVVRFVPDEGGFMERVTLSKMLNPFQYSDLKAGRLVCVNEIEAFDGRLTDEQIRRLKEGNRAARSDYHYGQVPGAIRELEMQRKVIDVRNAESRKVTHESAERIGEYFADRLTTKVPVAASL